MFATTRRIAVALLIVAFVSASVSAASIPSPRSYLVSDLYSFSSRQFIGSFSFKPNMENRDLVTVRVEKPFNFTEEYLQIFGHITLFDRVSQECQTINIGEEVKNIKGEKMTIPVGSLLDLADNATFKFELLANSRRGNDHTILDRVVILHSVSWGQGPRLTHLYSRIGCGRIRYADSTDDFLEELYTKKVWPPLSPLIKLKAVASVTTDGESPSAPSSVAVSDLYSAADQKFVGSFSYVRKLGNRDVATIEVETTFNLTSKYLNVFGAIWPFEAVKPECATDGNPSSVAVSDLYSAADQKFVGSFSYGPKLGNRDVLTIEVETPFNFTSKYLNVHGAIWPFETVKPGCATDRTVNPIRDINGHELLFDYGDGQILANNHTFHSIELANLISGDQHTILDHVLVMNVLPDTRPYRLVPIACGRIRYADASADNFLQWAPAGIRPTLMSDARQLSLIVTSMAPRYQELLNA